MRVGSPWSGSAGCERAARRYRTRMTASKPPDAAGLRFDWSDVPECARAAVEDRLGSPVVSAASQSAGFSPGVAARLRTDDGRRFFAKAELGRASWRERARGRGG